MGEAVGFRVPRRPVQRCRPVKVGVDVNSMRKQLVYDVDPLADDRGPQR